MIPTPQPADLIQVSYGYGQSCYVSASALAAVTREHPKLRRYKADGSPLRIRMAGSFEPVWLPLHHTNIVERGTPRLAAGWKARTLAETERRFGERSES